MNKRIKWGRPKFVREKADPYFSVDSRRVLAEPLAADMNVTRQRGSLH